MSLSRLFRPRRLLLTTLIALALFAAQLVIGAQSGFASRASCGAQPADWSTLALPVGLGVPPTPVPPLRVVSYNLHSGLGSRLLPLASRAEVEGNLRAIAAHIAGAGAVPADAVALNEVDFGSRRTGWIDQATFLAEQLRRLTGEDYQVVRGETWRRDIPGLEVRFGNALLVRHPVVASRSCLLDGPCGAVARRWFGGEPRGVLQATLEFHGRELDLLVSHLEAFAPGRRERQAAELRQRFVRPGRTTVLLGDMNAVAAAAQHKRWFVDDDRSHDILTAGKLQDARVVLAARAGLGDLSSWATYPAALPAWALDGAFASPELLPESAHAIGDPASSDHRGLLVRYRWLSPDMAAIQAQWHQSLQHQQRQRLKACFRPRTLPAPALQAIWAGMG